MAKKRIGFMGTIVIDPKTGKPKLVGLGDPQLRGVKEQHEKEREELTGKKK